LRVSKNKPQLNPWVTTVSDLNFSSLAQYIKENGGKVNQDQFEDEEWTLVNAKTRELLDKIKLNSMILEDYIENKIYYGIKTGYNKAFVIDVKIRNQLIQEDKSSIELIKKFAIGKDIKRYDKLRTKQFLIFIPSGWTNMHTPKNAWGWFSTEYPAIANYLLQYEQKAKKRWDQGDFWWELRPCSYYEEFDKPKITWGNLAITPKFTIDYEGYYINAPSVIISSDDLYLLGILNSKLCYFFISKIAAERRGGFLEYKPVYVSKIPIHKIDNENAKEFDKHNQIVSLVESMLELHRRTPQTPFEQEQLEREIAATDAQIDRLVYELYGLTEEEIKIVEGE
jgi:hypothetical protein